MIGANPSGASAASPITIQEASPTLSGNPSTHLTAAPAIPPAGQVPALPAVESSRQKTFQAALEPSRPSGFIASWEPQQEVVAPEPSLAASNPVQPAVHAVNPTEAPAGGEGMAVSALAPMDGPADSPLALDGFCAVALGEEDRWAAGDSRWSVLYGRHRYLFSGPAERDRFLNNPQRYAPVSEGFDPVVLGEDGRSVLGRTDFCVVFEGRLYMFSNASSLARFRQNPRHYITR